MAAAFLELDNLATYFPVETGFIFKRTLGNVRAVAPMNPPVGCRFHPRCPFMIEACKAQIPPLEDWGGNHFAACIRVAKINESYRQPCQPTNSKQKTLAGASISKTEIRIAGVDVAQPTSEIARN